MDAVNQKLALDLSVQAFQKVRGPITMIGTWLRVDDDWQPCVAFVRGFDSPADWNPFIVTLDRAFLFQTPSVNPGEAVLIAAQAVRHMRLTEDSQMIRRVISLIEDHLDDILHIPPMPQRGALVGDVVADVIVTERGTGKSVHEAVLDNV